MPESVNNPGQNQPDPNTPAQQQQQQAPNVDEPIQTPFDDIDTTLLDDDAVAKIEAGKKQFIETAKANKALEQKWQQQNSVASKFQSEADRLRAENAKLKGQDPNQPPKDPYLARAHEFLRARGATEDEIGKTGKFYADLFRESTSLAKEELGKELAPFAGSVVTQSATLQFQTAMQTCEQMQHPEVAEEVWKAVEQYVQQGQSPDADWMANYAKIIWVDKKLHLAHDPSQQQQQPPSFGRPLPPSVPPRTTMPSTTFTFPGSGNLRPTFNPPVDPNAPKTVLNDDTRNALQTVFSRMGSGLEIYPKNFKPQGSKFHPGNRPRK